jgi:site-specific recombinase XerD
MYNTGARVSELIGLKVSDADLDRTQIQSIRVLGKGRKERRIPLWRETARSLRRWFARLPAAADGPAFPNRRGAPLTRSGVEAPTSVRGSNRAPPVRIAEIKAVSLHTFRHTTAMHLLQAGVDLSVITLVRLLSDYEPEPLPVQLVVPSARGTRRPGCAAFWTMRRALSRPSL